MSTLIVLIIAVGVIVFVFTWSTRLGDKNRSKGTSLKRGASAHTTSRGRPKKGYASKEQAQAQAQAYAMSQRDGSNMSAYQCPTCHKWHVGHS